jgi:hypothetical protein
MYKFKLSDQFSLCIYRDLSLSLGTMCALQYAQTYMQVALPLSVSVLPAGTGLPHLGHVPTGLNLMIFIVSLLSSYFAYSTQTLRQ